MTKEEAVKKITSVINRLKAIKPPMKKTLITTFTDIVSDIDSENQVDVLHDRSRPFANSVKKIRDEATAKHTTVMTEQLSTKSDDIRRARTDKEKAAVKNPVNKW